MATPVTKVWQRLDSNGKEVFYRSITSTSNRVGKKYVRRQTAHAAQTSTIKKIARTQYADAWGFYYPSARTAFPSSLNKNQLLSDCSSRALAKFNGKLRKGSASLGITIAQWGQANEMITHRLGQVAGLLGARIKQLERKPRKVKQFTEQTLASQVLEVEFGWKPLFDDLHAAMYTVCQDGIPPTYVAGRHKEAVSIAAVPVKTARGYYSDAFLGSVSSTVCADVSISNPNLWLLNRLGLINPLGVLWDAIPWSFLVGAFVNVNAMINSLTNEVGLSITNKSVTETSRILWTHNEHIDSDGTHAFHQLHRHEKARTLGSLPSQKWQVRVPDVSFETALILSSLVVQRATKISSLIRKTLS